MARIRGTAERDVLRGTNTADLIEGRNESDFLSGGAGKDTLDGGRGNDMLVDGAGVDELIGGSGSDVFSFTSDGKLDRIKDFERNADLIDLARLGVSSFEDITIRKRGDDVIISAGGEKIRIENAKKKWFDADTFILADQDPIDFEAQEDPENPEEDEYFPDFVGDYDFNRIGVLRTDKSDIESSGYIPTSGDNVAFNGAGGNSSIFRDLPFDVESAMIGAAWREDLNIVVSGYLGDEYLGTQAFQVSPSEPTFIEFDDAIFDYVQRLEINAYGGTPTDSTTFDWTQMSIDDLLLLG